MTTCSCYRWTQQQKPLFHSFFKRYKFFLQTKEQPLTFIMQINLLCSCLRTTDFFSCHRSIDLSHVTEHFTFLISKINGAHFFLSLNVTGQPIFLTSQTTLKKKNVTEQSNFLMSQNPSRVRDKLTFLKIMLRNPRRLRQQLWTSGSVRIINALIGSVQIFWDASNHSSFSGAGWPLSSVYEVLWWGEGPHVVKLMSMIIRWRWWQRWGSCKPESSSSCSYSQMSYHIKGAL